MPQVGKGFHPLIIFIETRNKVFKLSGLNPLHPNIIMHILHTVLYTIAKVLTRRIC